MTERPETDGDGNVDSFDSKRIAEDELFQTGFRGIGGGPETEDDHRTGATGMYRNATRRGFLGAVGALTAGAVVGGVASGSQEELTGRTVSTELSAGQRATLSGAGGWSEFGIQNGLGKFAEAAQTSSPETLKRVWKQEFDSANLSLFPGTPESEYVFAQGFDQDPSTPTNTIHTVNKSDGTVQWSKGFNSQPFTSYEPGRALYHNNPETNSIVASAVDDGSELWSTSTQAQGGGIPFYYRTDSGVYVLGDSQVLTLDSSDGSDIWSTTVPGNSLFPPFVDFYDDGGTSLLFVLSNDVGRDSSGPGYVSAFDRDSGTEQWTEQRSPLAIFARNIGDALYCTFGREGTNELVSLDAGSGTENWADEREDDLIWGFAYPGQGDTVYVDASRNPDNAPTEGELVKFGSDGSRIWSYDAGAQIRGIESVNNTVYIATADGRVESITDDSSADNYGETGWSKDLGAEITNAGLNLAGGVLYTGVTSDPGTVYALSADDGSELDSYTLDSGITATVIPSDGRVWVTGQSESLTSGDSALYALGEDGEGGGGGGGDEWYSEYVNENGVVDTSGLRAGISDWRSGDISTGELRTLIASWRSGDPIDQ